MVAVTSLLIDFGCFLLSILLINCDCCNCVNGTLSSIECFIISLHCRTFPKMSKNKNKQFF